MKYRSELLYEYAKEHIRDQDVPPILVPSYNRPDAKLLQRLLVEPELPVILCIRREQEELYSRWKDKCAFLLLDNVHDISETRAEIVRQVSPYLNQAFMFDDDINELDYLIPSLTRNGVESMRTSKLNTGYVARYIDILKMWLCLIKQADSKLTLSSLLYHPDSWHLKNKNAPTEYNNGACIQCVWLNLEQMSAHSIQYKPHSIVGNEDYALQFDIMSQGLLTTVFTDLMYGCPAVNSHPGGCQNANGYSDANERYKWYVSCAKTYYGNHPGIKYTTTKEQELNQLNSTGSIGGKMNTVIEGCDGTGKSTIAKHLCERFGLQYWHESQPRTFDEYKQMLEYGGFVFDRFCFGQFVYNPPEQQKMSFEELKTLLRDTFPKTGTILLYVDVHTDTIIQRLIARGEGNEKIRSEMEKYIKNIRGTYRSVLRRAEAAYIEINGEGGANYHDSNN